MPRSSFEKPGLVIPVRHAKPPEPPKPGSTFFRIGISDVQPHQQDRLKAALKNVDGIEWREEWFEHPHHTGFITGWGVMDWPAEKCAARFLGELTHICWDVLIENIADPPEEHPDVFLDLNPGDEGELQYWLDARHFGQYKRRRREYEARGGTIAERLGLPA